MILTAGTASAWTLPWKPGWDNLSEPLNYAQSNVKWSVPSATGDFKITYTLVGAQPTRLYQVGVHLFCTSRPAMFGRFPAVGGAGPCTPITRNGVTLAIGAFEFGAILTDASGNGSAAIDLGPVAAGTYKLEFDVRHGAGCDVAGGDPSNASCNMDFQSPGPFGKTTKIVVP